jgi:hypothetical protein
VEEAVVITITDQSQIGTAKRLVATGYLYRILTVDSKQTEGSQQAAGLWVVCSQSAMWGCVVGSFMISVESELWRE